MASFATSYIPTGASAVTRAADVCSINGINFSAWYNHKAGTFYVAASINGYNALADGTRFPHGIARFTQEASSTGNGRSVALAPSNTPMRYTSSSRSAALTTTAFDTFDNIIIRKPYRYAVSYENNTANGLSLSVEGRNTVSPSLAANDVEPCERLLIGRGTTGSIVGQSSELFYLNGHIRRFTYWPQRFSDSTLPVLSGS
jgi:hypothetical protein